MSHELDFSKGRAAMAYAEGSAPPWHKHGQTVPANASIEQWRKAAGLDYQIVKAELLMRTEDGKVHDCASLNRSVLYRDDTMAPLSVMATEGYNIHQTDEILDFIFSSAQAMGWKMETAGALKGGRVIWGLANIAQDAEIGAGDRMKGYLLASTSFDGSTASPFGMVSTRVVCANTLQVALNESGQSRVKVLHSTELNAATIAMVKQALGIADSAWARFIENAKRLTKIKLSNKDAVAALRKVYMPAEHLVVGERITDEQFFAEHTQATRVMNLFDGDAIGSQLTTAKGTAWGLVNAVTEQIDHHGRARSVENKINNSLFGQGAWIKQRALQVCLDME